MKYAGGDALDRIGNSRSSSSPIVTRTGAAFAWAVCCAATGDGRAIGLLAADAHKGIEKARTTGANIFTEGLHSNERELSGQDLQFKLIGRESQSAGSDPLSNPAAERSK